MGGGLSRTRTQNGPRAAESVHIVDFISDDESDTHVLLARWSDQLVVAFRGTSSKKNWYSNARFKQVCMHRPAHVLYTLSARVDTPTRASNRYLGTALQ
jgi:hypothetical protein